MMIRIREAKTALVTAMVTAGLIVAVQPVIAQQTEGQQTQGQEKYNPSMFSGLRWRMLGPFRAGRVNGVTGVPGQPSTFYFGSVGGGVWKSTNSGRTWA